MNHPFDCFCPVCRGELTGKELARRGRPGAGLGQWGVSRPKPIGRSPQRRPAGAALADARLSGRVSGILNSRW